MIAKSSTTLKRRAAPLDLPLRLERAGSQPAQLHASLRTAILEGRLPSGDRLPSSRDLAAQLCVPRNVVVAAYEHLLSDGLVEATLGAGTFVAAQLPPGDRSLVKPTYEAAAISQAPFALGRTYTDQELLRRLGIAIRRRVLAATGIDRGYGDPRGNEDLRFQIAAQLGATRGIRCSVDQIIILNGTQQALRFCSDALLERGDHVWFEDPGYPASRTALQDAGVKIVPVPVDEQGFDVSAAKQISARARAVYVTPSHQFPTGVTMTMNRRIALLEWARSSDAWIFEDDYNSEFRYAGPPLTALAGIDGCERVIYLGTFSKTMFSSLRLAYAVLPARIVRQVVNARASYDRFPPSFVEGAVADLMADGFLAAHTRRMRTRYREARDAVSKILVEESHGRLSANIPDQGLHMIVTVADDPGSETAKRIRAAAKVESWLLSDTRAAVAGPDGFVIGFAGHALRDIKTAAQRLARAARNDRRRK